MKRLIAVTSLVCLAASVVLVRGDVVPRFPSLYVGSAVSTAEESVSLLTVRWRPGVNKLDSNGHPNGTAGITGIRFELGAEILHGIHGVRISPAVSMAEAERITDHLKATGLVDVADAMAPIHSTAEGQWSTCAGTGTGTDVCEVKQSWYTTIVGAATGWNDSSANAPGIKVAVLDSGYLNHPDLQANLLPGYDFIGASKIPAPNVWDTTHNTNIDGFASGGDGDGFDATALDEGQGRDGTDCHTTGTTTWDFGNEPFHYDFAVARDMHWHGTEVASIIAAERNNTAGISGIAPKVKIVPVRVLGRCIETDDPENLVKAMLWAAGETVNGSTNANPVQVINMSLGARQYQDRCPAVYQEAIDIASSRGIVVVASAGNNVNRSIIPQYDASINSPSNCNHVISVGASDHNNQLAYYSYTNADIVAPGGDGLYAENGGDYTYEILTASNTELRHLTSPVYRYMFGAGTSFSAPVVSGAVALVKSKFHAERDNARLNSDGMEALLKYASTDNTCTGCGSGILNIPRLLQFADPNAEPTVPQNLARAGFTWDAHQMRVSWDAPVSDSWNPIANYTATAFSAPSGGSQLDTCVQSDPAIHSCIFTNLSPDSTVYVAVKGTTGYTSSAYSARVSMATGRLAAAPTNVRATGGSNKVTLSWDAVTDLGDFDLGFVNYNLIAYNAASGGSIVSSSNSQDTTGEITGLTSGTTYWVAVQRMANNDNARISARVEVTTTGSAPSSPTTTVPASGNGGSTSGSGSSPSTSGTTAPTAKVGKSTTGSSLAKSAKMTVAAGAKVSVKVAAASSKFCKVSGTSVKALKAGSCKVTVTVTPKKGKATSKTVTLKVT